MAGKACHIAVAALQVGLIQALGMSHLSRQNQIWNRACLESGGTTPAAGDTALAALLLAHGLAMNGGVSHAMESLTRDEVVAAIAGFEFFGLAEAADVFRQAPGGSEEADEGLDAMYTAAIPSDEALAHAFRLKLVSNPEAFAPTDHAAHA